jgi:hypothetical protein
MPILSGFLKLAHPDACSDALRPAELGIKVEVHDRKMSAMLVDYEVGHVDEGPEALASTHCSEVGCSYAETYHDVYHAQQKLQQLRTYSVHVILTSVKRQTTARPSKACVHINVPTPSFQCIEDKR